MTDISLVPAVPEHHFSAIAALISSQETEPSTQETLTAWYRRQMADGIQFTVAVDSLGRVLGFNGLYRHNLNIPHLYGLYLIVDPGFRHNGLGSCLYDDLLARAAEFGARTLRIHIRDTCHAGIRFALNRGFVEKKHTIEMLLDLDSWDAALHQPILHALQDQGFHFTSMAELGDTRDARQKLFALNNSAAATDPGSDGVPPWASFEEFERDVCSACWYRPEGQIVAIHTPGGEWAAMSAITVFQGADHAYNLFTGTDVRFRGRKLATAVKSLALCKASQFGVNKVRTSHDSDNAAMIAIDTRLGYQRTPGTLVMTKELEND
jgi:mycothiol synthase